MNILLCGASMGIGGAETHILSLALALSERGHRVSVAAERGELCDELKKKKIRFIRVPLSSSDMRSVSKSRKIMKKILLRWDFDVVHAHSRLSALIVSEIRRKEGLDFRFIVTAHARYKTSRALRYLSVWGDRCIAVSGDIKKHLIKNYRVSEKRIAVIPNGIDTKRFSPIHKGKKHSVLFVSRLDKDCSRGAELLCGIAPVLSKKFPDLNITVAGEGDDHGRILYLARKANAHIGRECVSLVGKCTDMPGLIGKHSLVVGVSRVALEAMAMEKPVLLFGNEGALGLFDGKKLPLAVNTNFTCRGFGNGFGSEFLLRETEKAFTMDSKTRGRLCRLERRVVCEKYSLDKVADMTLAAYGSSPKKRPNILIGGYYGFGNLGDESVLFVIARELRRLLPNCRIMALTDKGGSVKGVKGINRKDPLEIMNAMKRSDVYISGGGSLFQNRTSNRSLAYYCELIKLAGRMGNKIVILANGIGPLKGKWANKMTADALASAHHVSVRDMESFLKVMSITKGKVVPRLSADPAFLYPDVNKKYIEILQGTRYAAIALKGEKCNRSLISALEEFCKVRRLLPVFVPMDTKNDIKACERAAACCGGVTVNVSNINDVKTVLKNAEIAIGERLHFLIFALKCHTPFVPLAADPKIDSFSFEVFGEEAVRVSGGEEASDILEKIEKFIKENHHNIDEKEIIRSFVGRAKADIKAVSKICAMEKMEKCGKGVEKN